MFLRLRVADGGPSNASPTLLVVDNQTLAAYGSAKQVTWQRIFTPDDADEDMYEELAEAIVPHFARRHNVCLVLHGPTASGKTHTLEGLAPVLFERLKPALLYAEQCAAEGLPMSASGADGAVGGFVQRRRLTIQRAQLLAPGAGVPLTVSAVPSDTAARPHSAPLTRRRLRLNHLSVTPTGARDWAAALSPTAVLRPPGSPGGASFGFPMSPLRRLGSPTFSVQQPPSRQRGPQLVVARGDPARAPPPRTVPQRQAAAKTAQPVKDVARPVAGQRSAVPEAERKERAQRYHRQKGLTHLPKNGRGGRPEWVPQFPALRQEAVYVTIPPIAELCTHRLVSFSIELWIRTSERRETMCLVHMIDRKALQAQVLIELHRNVHGDYEDGSLCLSVVDVTRREVVATLRKDVCDDRWHFLQFQVLDLPTNRVQILVDGLRAANLAMGRTDGPANFAGVDPWVGLGRCLLRVGPTGELETSHQFVGCLFGLRIYDASRELIGEWPMGEGEGTELADTRRSRTGVLVNGVWAEVDVPEPSLYFNGQDTFINVGNLGEFGSHLGNCSVDLWFRTGTLGEPMSVLHITDNKRKRAQLSVAFNTDARFNYAKGCTLFYLRDARGDVLSGIIRTEMYDNQWHSLSWKVSNAANNQMSVAIDANRVELEFDQQNSPQNFVAWDEWLCIGAANLHTGGRAKRPTNFFKGYLKEVRLMAGHSVAAHWPLREGVGAKVVFDCTGHGHNGVCRQGLCWTTTWHPLELPFNLLRRDLEDEGGRRPEEEQRWANNDIRMAYLQVRSVQNESGLYGEALYDVVHHCPVPDLQPASPFPARPFAAALAMLPEECWQRSGSARLLADFTAAHRSLPGGPGHGHNIITVQLGDARLTIFDLVGLFLPPRSTFQPETFAWVMPKTNFGAEQKQRTCLNRALAAFEATLLQLSTHPQLFKRAAQQLDPSTSTSYLARLLSSAVLVGDEPARLCCVATALELAAPPEAFSTLEFGWRLQQRAEHLAAVVAQKAVRAAAARVRCRALAAAREEARQRQRRIAELRSRCPEATEPKAELRALVIAVQRYDDLRLPALPSALQDCEELAGVLERLGYAVTLMHSDAPDPALLPTRDNILFQIRAVPTDDVQLLVFLVCHGTRTRYYGGPSATQLEEEDRCLAVAAEEEARRAAEALQPQATEELTPQATGDTVEEEKERPKPDPKAARDRPARRRSAARGKPKPKPKAGDSARPGRRAAGGGRGGGKGRPGDEAGHSPEPKPELAPSAGDARDIDQKPRIRPEGPCVDYLWTAEAPLEAQRDRDLTLADLSCLVAGAEPRLGRHTLLAVEAVGVGGRYWWADVPDEGDDGPQHFFFVQGSSHQWLRLNHPTSPSWGPHYLRKGLLGAAQPRRRRDAPAEEGERVSLAALFAYLRARLVAVSQREAGSCLLVSEGDGEYVGEFHVSRTILMPKAARREAKRLGQHRPAMLCLTLEVRLTEAAKGVAAWGDWALDAVRQLLREAEAPLAAPTDLGLREGKVGPQLRLTFQGSLLHATRVRHHTLWRRLLAEYLNGKAVDYHFENAQTGNFTVVIQLPTDTAAAHLLRHALLFPVPAELQAVAGKLSQTAFTVDVRLTTTAALAMFLQKLARRRPVLPVAVPCCLGLVRVLPEEEARRLEEHDQREARERAAREQDQLRRQREEEEARRREAEAAARRQREWHDALHRVARSGPRATPADLAALFATPPTADAAAAALPAVQRVAAGEPGRGQLAAAGAVRWLRDVLRLPPPTEESTIAATCALLPPLLAGEVADRAALCQETIDVLLATLPRCPAVVPALLAALPAATPRQCDAVVAAAAALVGAEGAAEGLVEGGCRLLRAACDGADGAAEKLRAAVGLRPLAHCLQRHLANVAVQEAGLLVLQLLCPPADPEDTQLVLSLLLNACHLVSDSDHGHPVLLSPIVALTATLKSSTAPTPDFLPPDLSAALRAIHTTLPPQHPMHDPLAAVL